MEKETDQREESVRETISSLKAPQLGTLAFNLSAIAWIGLNVSFRGLSPCYMPASYVHPNFLNIICGALLLYSAYLAGLAVKKGSLLPAIITFTFVWSLLATVVRQFAAG